MLFQQVVHRGQVFAIIFRCQESFYLQLATQKGMGVIGHMHSVLEPKVARSCSRAFSIMSILVIVFETRSLYVYLAYSELT